MWTFNEIAGKKIQKNKQMNQANYFKRIETEDKIVCVIGWSKIGMKLEKKECNLLVRYIQIH